jgi:hypothetical protein
MRVVIACLLSSIPLVGVARADDPRREIQLQRAAAQDLDALDTKKQVADEIALLRSWLDEAEKQRAREQAQRAREVLDRCQVQTDLIREKLTTARVVGEAAEHEKAAKDSRERLKATKKALEDALVKKKSLEATSK